MVALSLTTWLLTALLVGATGLPLEPSATTQKKQNEASAESEGIDDAEDPYCPLYSDDNGMQNNNANVLNVHVVPHSHDDVGWLKTVDQYYYGLNDTIQLANVSAILDSVLTALLDPQTSHNRTFTYVETKFFSKWYTSLPPHSSKQDSIKSLIAQKQYSFANGGWCMHDEATTHFMGQIDQTSLGHAFLKKELGVVPKVGWQLDPFGHSATQGGLMTSGVGFDSLFFGRMHYVDLERRKGDAECEGLWRTSSGSTASVGDDDDDGSSSSSVFWGLSGSYSGNYGAPDGFCFDVYCGDSYQPLVGQSEDVLLERIKNFTHLLGIQANQTKGRNIMLTMGLDFYYTQASTNFRNMDLLIDATNKFLADGSIKATDVFGRRFDKLNIFYSTPERYTKCKYADAVHAKRHNNENNAPNNNEAKTAENKYDPATWQDNAKTGDFFPYADCDHCYWAGYFSSRQGFKRMERVGSSFLHAARQIEAMVELQQQSPPLTTDDGVKSEAEEIMVDAAVGKSDIHSPEDEKLAKERSWTKSPLYTLDDAMGIAQHHDAVTGTAKQHVSDDYAKRISKGMSDASLFVTAGLRELLLLDSSSRVLDNLSYCYLLNETVCEVSQDASLDNEKVVYAVVYNALANERTEVVPLPVDSASNYLVERLDDERLGSMDWSAVESSLVPNSLYTKSPAAQFALYFKAFDIPPLGASVFRIRKQKDALVPSLAMSRSMIKSEARSLPEGTTPSHLRTSPKQDRYTSQAGNEFEVLNGVLSVTFDRSTGAIKAISQLHEGGASVSIEHEYGFYEAFSHEDGLTKTAEFEAVNSLSKNDMPWRLWETARTWQNAGAYILRPTPDQSFHVVPPKVVPNSVVVHEADFFTEVHAEFGGGWIKQITRLIEGKDYVEVEYVVGPIPINDRIGKEVVSRYSTNIESGDTFYTDSNGREFMRRKRDDPRVFGYDTPEYDPELEPIAGNYYPVNTAIFIEDPQHRSSFSVLVDRSQGGSSLSNGSLELLIQRRFVHDDHRGVDEPLNETDIGVSPYPPYGNATRSGEGVIVKGTHRLMIGKNGASQARSRMDESFSQPHVFVASAPEDAQVPFRQASTSMFKASLPENVMVVTFAALDKADTFLVRLAHQYGKAESEIHSDPVNIDLRDLFNNRDIVSITEKTLSANQDRSDWEKRRLQWNIDRGADEAASLEQDAHDIMLKPLEIRTFEVRLL